jgi:uncharacterized delta-60 repeat protein
LAVSVLPNGSFLVTGNLISFGVSGALLQTYALTKFTENGVLDKSFADNGLFRGDFTERFIVSKMLYRQPDGKLLIGGADPTIDSKIGTYTMVVARVLENGQPDTSFGERGIARITAIDGGVMPERIYGFPNGQLVIAGVSDLNFRKQFALTRLTAQGRLDLTFAQNGRALYSMKNEQTEFLTDMVIQPDEKMLLTGYVFHNNGTSLALARVLPSGQLDAQFANGGILTETLGNQYAVGRAVTIQPDGKVVVAGDVRSDSSERLLMLARYNVDGTRDTTFATR